MVTPARVFAPGWVLVDGDRIADVGAGAPPRPAGRGAAGGHRGPRVRRRARARRRRGVVRRRFARGRPPRVVRAHLAHGTTSMTASLVTDRVEGLAVSVRNLADVADDGVITGIHLEGPWLSPMHAGAHDPALLTDPKPAQVEALLEAGRGHLRMVTLAPELPGGLDAIRRLHRRRRGRRRSGTPTRRTTSRVAALDAGASVGHPPVQRDARPAPPRAGPGRGAPRAPRRVRRADRRRRPRPSRRAPAGRRRQAAPDRPGHRRDGRRGRGRRRLPAGPADRVGPRRCRPARGGRRHRRLDPDHGRGREVRRPGGRPADRGRGPGGHRLARRRCSAWTGSVPCCPASARTWSSSTTTSTSSGCCTAASG